MEVEKEYEKVIKYNELVRKNSYMDISKVKVKRLIDVASKDLEDITNRLISQKDKDKTEELVEKNIIAEFAHVKKHYENVLEELNILSAKMTKEYEQAKKEASEFYKKYFVFTSREIIDTINETCKFFGRKKPSIIIDTGALIFHNEGEGPKNKRSVSDFRSEIAKHPAKGHILEKDIFVGYKLNFYLNQNPEGVGRWYSIPLDLDMKMTDHTTLEKHLATKVVERKDDPRKPEYYTKLYVKPSAHGKFIIPLDFTKISTNSRIVQEFHSNLLQKVLLREFAREKRAEKEKEKTMEL